MFIVIGEAADGEIINFPPFPLQSCHPKLFAIMCMFWHHSLCLYEYIIQTYTMQTSVVVPHKVKHRLTIWPSKPTPKYTPKRNEIRRSNTCTQIFTAVLVTPAKKQKPPKCPSTDKWISKLESVHTMECYSATKRNEVLTHVTAWRNLENIMLRERSQAHIVWFRPCV